VAHCNLWFNKRAQFLKPNTCNFDPGNVNICLLHVLLNKGILFGENPCVTLDIIQNEAGNHIPVGFDIPWMDSQRKSTSLHIEQY
jgi:hypothetical protein